MMYHYDAYQLRFKSEIILNELAFAPPSNEYDVSIQLREVPLLSTPVLQSLYYQVQPEACRLEIPNIVRFLIRHGQEIWVEPLNHADEDSIRLFLYTIGIPCLLIQRNYFLLQGAAVQVQTKNIAFLTHFGQGKSTLLAAFLQHQARFISDDFCVLNPNFELLPGIPYLHLRENTLKKLQKTPSSLKRVRPTIEKWVVPISSYSLLKPLVLHTIYVIKPVPQSDFRITQLFGLQKIQCMNQYVYQPSIVRGSGKSLFYFQKCPELAAHITLIQIERPEFGFQLDELVNCILEAS